MQQRILEESTQSPGGKVLKIFDIFILYTYENANFALSFVLFKIFHNFTIFEIS